MSNVIVFEPDRRETTTVAPYPVSAQILFFTGVRYVRDLDLTEVVDPIDAPLPVATGDCGTMADGRTERLQA